MITMENLDRYFIPEPNSGCWLWINAIDKDGYAKVWHYGTCKGHKVIFELFNGPVPAGLELDHKCRVRSCVNPAHLEPITHAINVKRGIPRNGYAERTHCPHGHAYEKGNIYVTSKGHRKCRLCTLRRVSEYGFHLRRLHGSVGC